MIDVSVIIVSYNTAELTCAAVASVYYQTKKYTVEIFVVDNNSKDDSVSRLEKNFPDIKLLKLDENIGFAAANNLAANHVTGRYVLLLNPDTIVLDSALDRLVAWADANPEWGIYGGSTFFADLRRNPTSGWYMSTVWSLFCIASGLSTVFRRSRIFNSESLVSWAWDKPREVDIVTGCFMLMKLEHWNKLHGFDLQFKMYGEDADICLRSAALGALCIIVPEAGIIHYGGASERVREDKMVRLMTAKVQLFRKHWKGVKEKYAIFMLKTWAFSRMTALFLISLLRKNYSSAFCSWKNVWLRRNEWETV